MKYLRIKYYPCNISEYIYTILSNILILNLIVFLIFFLFNENKKNNYNADVLLLIPKTLDEFEEKRDLIFNQLSLKKEILSLDLIEEKKIIKILSNALTNTEIKENFIPEVYKLSIKKGGGIDINELNSRISKIINGSKIINMKKTKNKIYYLYTILLTTIFLMFFLNLFFIKNFIKNNKKYFLISKYFGVNDSEIIKNFNLGLLSLILISFLFSNLFLFIIIDYVIKDNFDIRNYIVIFSKALIIYMFVFSIILSIQIKSYLKKST